jgi:putative ABC transport system permease protein
MRNRMTFVIRTAGDPAALAGQVRDAVAELDRNRPIADARPVEEDVAAVIAPSRYVAVVLGLFAGIALLLAAVGAYGVVSHGIGQRTREIGVRMALGAQRRDVLRLVLTDVLMLASIGVGVGLAGTVALTRLMPSVVAGMVWDVAPMDTATYLAVSMLMALVALLAGWIPTQRALRVAPTVALRSE